MKGSHGIYSLSDDLYIFNIVYILHVVYIFARKDLEICKHTLQLLKALYKEGNVRVSSNYNSKYFGCRHWFASRDPCDALDSLF